MAAAFVIFWCGITLNTAVASAFTTGSPTSGSWSTTTWSTFWASSTPGWGASGAWSFPRWPTFWAWSTPSGRTSGTWSTTELATSESLSPKTTPGAGLSLSLSENATVEARKNDEPRDSLPCWAIPTIAVACAAFLIMFIHFGAAIIKQLLSAMKRNREAGKVPPNIGYVMA